MIHGFIDENKPMVAIEIGWNSVFQGCFALVDTGFTGELKISHDQAAELGLQLRYAENVTLGNDEVVEMLGTVALISMEGIARVVNVLVSRGETIIGVELLRKFGYELRLNAPVNSLVLQR
jgi:predicted aspartyl protease